MALDCVCPACGTLNDPADVKVTDEMVDRARDALLGIVPTHFTTKTVESWARAALSAALRQEER